MENIKGIEKVSDYYKKPYLLHYAELYLKGDIPCLRFNSYRKRLSKIQDIIILSRNKVFLLAIEKNDHDHRLDSVYVFEYFNCVDFINQRKYGAYKKMFLQEYSTYEEAFKVALSMKEESPMCYNP